eukprot:6202007-Pleurochrysis_carterae.AAC.1
MDCSRGRRERSDAIARACTSPWTESGQAVLHASVGAGARVVARAQRAQSSTAVAPRAQSHATRTLADPDAQLRRACLWSAPMPASVRQHEWPLISAMIDSASSSSCARRARALPFETMARSACMACNRRRKDRARCAYDDKNRSLTKLARSGVHRHPQRHSPSR